ncbi:MAG: IPT/TIG domain-containing protein, partial [Dehalococcoidales bacterium]|nr:IPT/TIG domain-containing protein [Dehalococcoidales bacterium]
MKRPAWLFFSMLALIIILILPAVSPDAAHAQAVEPVISGISPDTASGGTDSEITITGTGFGGAPGAVQFLYLNTSPPEFSPGQIISWSDTSIRLVVPPVLEGNEAYTDWPSSGPVKVVTSEGIESEGYPFQITFVYAGRKWAGNSPVVNLYINPNTADC